MRMLLTISIPLFILSPIMAEEFSSPNGKYNIKYHEAELYTTNVSFENSATGKALYQTISNTYAKGKFDDIAWSPDSRYLAVARRGTKTTSDIFIYEFAGDIVKEIKVPDYALNILGRRELVRGGRHHRVSDIKWKDTTVTFHCTGQWEDGSGDPAVEPDNWYHFDVSIHLGGPGNAAQPRLVAVNESKGNGGRAKN